MRMCFRFYFNLFLEFLIFIDNSVDPNYSPFIACDLNLSLLCDGRHRCFNVWARLFKTNDAVS